MTSSIDIYKSKLTTPDEALKGLSRRATVVLGFFAAQPPGLVGALAKAIEAGDFDEVRLGYMPATGGTGTILLELEYCDILRPRPVFIGPSERAPVGGGGAGGPT